MILAFQRPPKIREVKAIGHFKDVGLIHLH
jgi:hypothetical protein